MSPLKTVDQRVNFATYLIMGLVILVYVITFWLSPFAVLFATVSGLLIYGIAVLLKLWIAGTPR